MERRRRKRSTLGVRDVQLKRGLSGYGFTVSGQYPCMLSCVVPETPAAYARLKPGDFLLSVNGSPVINIPHDEVVAMIGQATGSLWLQISRDNLSDTSGSDSYEEVGNNSAGQFLRGTTRHRSLDRLSRPIGSGPLLRAVVGYLGQMPISRELAPGTPRVRGCIGKLKVEKKVHTLVLFSLYPHGVSLQNPHGLSIAEYASKDISGSAGYSEDGRFFGVVVKNEENSEVAAACHVFMVDSRMHAHTEHIRRAKAFRLECTRDPGMCAYDQFYMHDFL